MWKKDEMPIVQGGISGAYIGLLEIKYSLRNQKVLHVDPKLIRVFKKDWQTSPMDAIVLDTINKYDLYKVIGKAKETLIHSRDSNQQFTALGSYVCMAFADKYREKVSKESGNPNLSTANDPVLSFMGFGSIRANLAEGNVTKLDAGEVLPFSGELVAYSVKGKDIKRFIEYGINNKTKGWLQMNNLKIDCICDQNSDSLRVVNIHYRVPNSVDIILNDNSEYPIVSIEFLLSGGDGYPNLKDVGKKIQLKLGENTDAFFDFFSGWKEELKEDSPYKARIEKIQKPNKHIL